MVRDASSCSVVAGREVRRAARGALGGGLSIGRRFEDSSIVQKWMRRRICAVTRIADDGERFHPWVAAGIAVRSFWKVGPSRYTHKDAAVARFVSAILLVVRIVRMTANEIAPVRYATFLGRKHSRREIRRSTRTAVAAKPPMPAALHERLVP